MKRQVCIGPRARAVTSEESCKRLRGDTCFPEGKTLIPLTSVYFPFNSYTFGHYFAVNWRNTHFLLGVKSCTTHPTIGVLVHPDSEGFVIFPGFCFIGFGIKRYYKIYFSYWNLFQVRTLARCGYPYSSLS